MSIKVNKKNKINNIINIQSISNKNNIMIKNVDGYFAEKFYFDDIYNDKYIKKFIKNCEVQIRTSDEYSSYLNYLIDTVGLDHCAILGNIPISDQSNNFVEFHHYPFTLYDIVYLNMMLNISKHKKFNSFTIIKNVISDHRNNIVGLVPLSETVHELTHAGEIFINLNQVFGDLNSFIKKYYSVMPDDLIEKYNTIIKNSEKNIPYSGSDILKPRT